MSISNRLNRAVTSAILVSLLAGAGAAGQPFAPTVNEPAKPGAASTDEFAPVVPIPKTAAPEIFRMEVGTRAPALKLNAWVQGSATAALPETGKVNVVMFVWPRDYSTRMGLARLEELSRKFADKGVRLLTVSIDSNAVFTKHVMSKVKEIKHDIALDTTMENAKAYLAGRYMAPFPSTFVIDRRGALVWIGKADAGDLESCIANVLEGKHDAKAWAQKFFAERDRMNTINRQRSDAAADIQAKINAAIVSGDAPKANEQFEKFLALFPDVPASQRSEMVMNHLRALTTCNLAAAKARTIESIDGVLKDDPMSISVLMERFTMEPDVRDEQVARKAIDRLKQLQEEEVAVIACEAEWAFMAGDRPKADALLAKALALPIIDEGAAEYIAGMKRRWDAPKKPADPKPAEAKPADPKQDGPK